MHDYTGLDHCFCRTNFLFAHVSHNLPACWDKFKGPVQIKCLWVLYGYRRITEDYGLEESIFSHEYPCTCPSLTRRLKIMNQ